MVLGSLGTEDANLPRLNCYISYSPTINWFVVFLSFVVCVCAVFLKPVNAGRVSVCLKVLTVAPHAKYLSAWLFLVPVAVALLMDTSAGVNTLSTPAWLLQPN